MNALWDPGCLLRTRGLCKSYGRGEGLVRAVDEIDLEVAVGETVAVMGPSGCGKSTLLHLVGGLDRKKVGALPSQGSPGLLFSTTEMPAAMLALYQEAASSCPGLPWTLLAAIGTVESDNGTSDAPGVQSGANSAGAEGPMQFEPATFAEYDQPVPPGGVSPPSP